MQFTLVSLVLALATFATASSAPPINYPAKGTAWYKGEKEVVIWKFLTKAAPSTQTNKNTAVFLRKGGRLYGPPLAKNFNLTAGHVFVTVPIDLDSGADYDIELFANGGHSHSHIFRIRDTPPVTSTGELTSTFEFPTSTSTFEFPTTTETSTDLVPTSTLGVTTTIVTTTVPSLISTTNIPTTTVETTTVETTTTV